MFGNLFGRGKPPPSGGGDESGGARVEGGALPRRNSAASARLSAQGSAEGLDGGGGGGGRVPELGEIDDLLPFVEARMGEIRERENSKYFANGNIFAGVEAWEGNRVRVAVRVRPPVGREEEADAHTPAVVAEPEVATVAVNEAAIGRFDQPRLGFDAVFGPHATQEDVYRSLCAPLLRDVMLGRNGTLMCYGQTGTGKSYTMGTDVSKSAVRDAGAGEPEGPLVGLLPRAIRQLFAEAAKDEGAEYEVGLSYVQLYREKFQDLLNPSEAALQLHDAQGSVFIENLTEHRVTSAEHALRLVRRGGEFLRTGGTRMNATSSRAHVILIVTVRRALRGGGGGGAGGAAAAAALPAEPETLEGIDAYLRGAQATSGRLLLLDLAGSERLKKSGADADGALGSEARATNLSLLALGNVVQTLAANAELGSASADPSAAGGTARRHVPYRDSKLTQLLRDSFGGECKTTLCVCVGPARAHAGETLSSLNFARRAMSIQAVPAEHLELQLDYKLLAAKQQRVLDALATRISRVQEYAQAHAHMGSVGRMVAEARRGGSAEARGAGADDAAPPPSPAATVSELGRLLAELADLRHALTELGEGAAGGEGGGEGGALWAAEGGAAEQGGAGRAAEPRRAAPPARARRPGSGRAAHAAADGSAPPAAGGGGGGADGGGSALPAALRGLRAELGSTRALLAEWTGARTQEEALEQMRADRDELLALRAAAAALEGGGATELRRGAAVAAVRSVAEAARAGAEAVGALPGASVASVIRTLTAERAELAAERARVRFAAASARAIARASTELEHATRPQQHGALTAGAGAGAAAEAGGAGPLAAARDGAGGGGEGGAGAAAPKVPALAGVPSARGGARPASAASGGGGGGGAGLRGAGAAARGRAPSPSRARAGSLGACGAAARPAAGSARGAGGTERKPSPARRAPPSSQVLARLTAGQPTRPADAGADAEAPPARAAEPAAAPPPPPPPPGPPPLTPEQQAQLLELASARSLAAARATPAPSEGSAMRAAEVEVYKAMAPRLLHMAPAAAAAALRALHPRGGGRGGDGGGADEAERAPEQPQLEGARPARALDSAWRLGETVARAPSHAVRLVSSVDDEDELCVCHCFEHGAAPELASAVLELRARVDALIAARPLGLVRAHGWYVSDAWVRGARVETTHVVVERLGGGSLASAVTHAPCEEHTQPRALAWVRAPFEALATLHAHGLRLPAATPFDLRLPHADALSARLSNLGWSLCGHSPPPPSLSDLVRPAFVPHAAAGLDAEEAGEYGTLSAAALAYNMGAVLHCLLLGQPPSSQSVGALRMFYESGELADPAVNDATGARGRRRSSTEAGLERVGADEIEVLSPSVVHLLLVALEPAEAERAKPQELLNHPAWAEALPPPHAPLTAAHRLLTRYHAATVARALEQDLAQAGGALGALSERFLRAYD